MTKANELKAVMVKNGDNQEVLAAFLCISTKALSNKINGVTDFKQSEITQIASRYQLTNDEIKTIFLN